MPQWSEILNYFRKVPKKGNFFHLQVWIRYKLKYLESLMNSVIIMFHWRNVYDNTQLSLNLLNLSHVFISWWVAVTAKYIFDFVTLEEFFDMLCFGQLTCSHWLLWLLLPFEYMTHIIRVTSWYVLTSRQLEVCNIKKFSWSKFSFPLYPTQVKVSVVLSTRQKPKQSSKNIGSWWCNLPPPIIVLEKIFHFEWLFDFSVASVRWCQGFLSESFSVF